MAVGCAEKDLYDPNYGKEPVKGPEEYFGFETRGDVSLDVNYALPGFAALIEVYDIVPMEIVDNTPVKNKEWKLYSRFTQMKAESLMER